MDNTYGGNTRSKRMVAYDTILRMLTHDFSCMPTDTRIFPRKIGKNGSYQNGSVTIWRTLEGTAFNVMDPHGDYTKNGGGSAYSVTEDYANWLYNIVCNCTTARPRPSSNAPKWMMPRNDYLARL